MKKIIAPALAVIFFAAGCSSAPEAEVKTEIKTTQETKAAKVSVSAEAPADLLEYVEIPAVEEQTEEVIYPEVTPEAYVADAVPTQMAPEAKAPAEDVKTVEPVKEEAAPEFIYEEAVEMPTCWQDESCYVPPSPQEWVHHLTGDNSLVIHTWEGLLPNGCDTLTTGICALDNAPDEDSTSYYMSQTVVGKAGWVPQIISVLGR